MIRCNKLFLAFMVISFIISSLYFSIPNIAAKTQKTNPPNNEFVSIDFNSVDIRVFIKFISNLTKKNFIIDKRVKGNVTIISPKRLSVEDAYKVFESVLDIHGFAAVSSGQVIKIIPLPNATSGNINTQLAQGTEAFRDQIVTRIILLEYASAEELKPLLTPLIPQKSIILSYRDTNMLIVTSTLSSINRILKIIRTIDIPSTGKKISVIPIKYANAKKLTAGLSKIFAARIKSTKNSPSKDINVKFVEDERTNSIIVLASKTETKRVNSLIKILDKQVPKGEEKIRVYYLEHASAENLVKVLLEIPSKENAKATSGQKKAPLLSSKVKIMADKATNSLIIMAEKEDYPVLEEVINKLDIPRAMVYIECLIMEVNVTRGLNVGTEWQVGQGLDNENSKVMIAGSSPNSTTAAGNLNSLVSGTLPQGFSVGVLGKSFNIGGVTFPDIRAVVQAFQSDKDVHILATPQILTTENEEATITVGKNVPYQTRSAAEAGTETYNSFEYKDVGITLKITPQISKDRLVRLNVYQELTKLDSSANSTTTDRPTTLKRQIETTIIVEDSNSVVIGGLIDESITKSVNKMPCLGDIPFLGWAVKSSSNEEDKTNLYVFLTPKVIKNPLASKKLYDQKRTEIQMIRRNATKIIRPILIGP